MCIRDRDPANPYGAALPWPDSTSGQRAARVAGAHVVLVDGEPAVFVERGGRRLVTFEAATRTDRWAEGLAELVKERRVRRLVVQQVDGDSAAASPFAGVLRAAGFVDGYRGLSLGA